jgi:hypothetical protein
VDVDLTLPPNAPAGSVIRYTTDGSEPGAGANLYNAPIRVTQASRIRARTFLGHDASATAFALDLAPDPRGYPNIGQANNYSASSQFDAGYPPSRAFDDETFSWLGWASGIGDNSPWIQTDFGITKRIRFIQLYTRAQLDSPESRRNFEIRASNDASFATYAVLHTQGGTPLDHQAVLEVPVSNANMFRYVRVQKTAPEFLFITELRVLGE